MARTATNVSVARRRLCIGDLSRRIKLYSRSLTSPAFGTADLGLSFTLIATLWCAIKTTSSKTFFDGVNQTEISVTHEVFIRFRSDVTAESWLETIDGRRLRVLSVEDYDEQKAFLRLLCTERGAASIEATKA